MKKKKNYFSFFPIKYITDCECLKRLLKIVGYISRGFLQFFLIIFQIIRYINKYLYEYKYLSTINVL